MEEPPKKRGKPSGKAKVKAKPKGSTALRQRFIEFLKQSGKPVSDEDLKTEFGTLEVIAGVMGPLLKKGNLQITQQDGSQFYAWVDEKKAAGLRELTDDQKHVYQIIAEHGNRGVHMRELKYKSSQSLPELKLTLKKLKTKQLVKSINDIDNKTRQIHILFDLVPHPDCTGGAWYSESEFDMQLIKEVRKVVLRLLKQSESKGERGITVQTLATKLKETRAFGVELSVDDILQLMNTMELDLKVRRVYEDDEAAQQEPGKTMFAVQAPPTHFNMLSQSPCGSCPVFDQCSPGGQISPQTCTYLDAWLGGAATW